ncbi:type II secretion system protein [Endozoicomonas sp. G2_1]|uniref:type II secretion system protein n=1 Tax=Endozoicomonas sp. G2_1 TaxID=2821091 RepID=UPI001ADC4879|nr:type II secretion system protein [Endozoicomonas sp. G2_1]MBO9489616.1 type II secretion system protein [Endozoicomonas sp. G2_1]
MRGQKGFTLVEMVTVIVLLGILSVGLTGFIRLVSQVYADTTENEALLANARFAVERLNRELRNAVPNSFVVSNISGSNCLSYTPIITSAIYRDIPVGTDTPVSSIELVAFSDFISQGVNGQRAVVYPINSGDSLPSSAKSVLLAANNAITAVSGQTNRFNLNFATTSRFVEESPTQRIFITSAQRQICLVGSQLTLDGVTLAEQVNRASSSFSVNASNLTRNATVQMRLVFNTDIVRNTAAGTDIEFYHEVHTPNVP